MKRKMNENENAMIAMILKYSEGFKTKSSYEVGWGDSPEPVYKL